MIPEDKKQAVLDNLDGDIREHGVRLTTGDVGNRYLFRALADNGLDSIMYGMHNHYDAPGYGYDAHRAVGSPSGFVMESLHDGAD